MNSKARILHLSYDPKTQRGLVLRLRAQLGQHFELRFRPIGVNDGGGGGKGKGKQKEEAPIDYFSEVLPVEILYMILGVLVKTNPSKEETKILFAMAGTSHLIRSIMENPSFENMISLRVLGARHSRSVAQRRLGIDGIVSSRFGPVLTMLGLSPEKLQTLAKKNKAKIVIKGEAA